MMQQILGFILLLFVFFLPGYFINKIYYHREGLDGFLTSFFISLSLVIIVSFALSLFDSFSFFPLTIIMFIIIGGSYLKWIFQ